MAFDAIDSSEDGQLQKEELGEVLRDISVKMGLHSPTDADLAYILHEMDQDDDGQVSRDEFAFLIIKVLEKMLESEIELQRQLSEHEPIVAK